MFQKRSFSSKPDEVEAEEAVIENDPQPVYSG